MTTAIKTVVLCSPTGKLGPHLLHALETEGFSVTVLLRESSKAVFSPSQRIVRVSDEYKENELISAFEGHDAVVLSLSFEMLSQSKRFAQASATAGNKWLIASTYGSNLEDPNHALFPASGPHRQAVEELQELQRHQQDWAWSSISCGPWPELAIAARAWNIDPLNKIAEIVDGGNNVFTSTTREQVSLTVARVLKLQPTSMRNKIIYVASFEADMMTWLDIHKQLLGEEGWKVTHTDCRALIERSQAQLAAGQFAEGYMGLALAVCTSQGFQNHFSAFATLVNDELDLPREDMVEVVKRGPSLPNPFG